MISELDADGDGDIEYAEWLKFCIKRLDLVDPAFMAIIEMRFQDLDASGDGILTRDDLKAKIREQAEMPPEMRKRSPSYRSRSKSMISKFSTGRAGAAVSAVLSPSSSRSTSPSPSPSPANPPDNPPESKPKASPVALDVGSDGESPKLSPSPAKVANTSEELASKPLLPGVYRIKTTAHKAGQQAAGWGLAAWNNNDRKRNNYSSWVSVHLGDVWPCDWTVSAGRTPGTYRISTNGHEAGGQPKGWGLAAWQGVGDSKRNDYSSWAAVHSGDEWPCDWTIVPGKQPDTWRILTVAHEGGKQPTGWGLSAWHAHGAERNDWSSNVAVHSGDEYPMDWVFEAVTGESEPKPEPTPSLAKRSERKPEQSPLMPVALDMESQPKSSDLSTSTSASAKPAKGSKAAPSRSGSIKQLPPLRPPQTSFRRNPAAPEAKAGTGGAKGEELGGGPTGGEGIDDASLTALEAGEVARDSPPMHLRMPSESAREQHPGEHREQEARGSTQHVQGGSRGGAGAEAERGGHMHIQHTHEARG